MITRRAISRLSMFGAACSLLAQPVLALPNAVYVPLANHVLADLPGKEVRMVIVQFPQGAFEPVHRHGADAFIYVLEGSIVMGLEGGRQLTLTAGQTFHEGPHDLHTVARNDNTASTAKYLLVLIKDKGVPIATELPASAAVQAQGGRS